MKISVIMPTYNRAFCISKSIESVLSQRIDNSITVELVIVDDCSTDNTFEVVKPYLSKNVIYHRNESNKGGAESRNVGVAISTGDFLSFIDSDVIWYENKLLSQVNKFSDDNDVIYCKYRKQDGDKWIIMPGKCSNGKVHYDLLFDNFVDTPSVFLTRKLFDKSGGFDKKLPRFQDWDLFLNISNFSTFTLLDEVLYDSKTLVDSITKNDLARLEAIKHIYTKYNKSISEDKNLLKRFCFKILNSYLLLGKKRDSFKFFIKEIKSFKLKIMILLILFILSIIPSKIYRILFRLR